MELTSPGFFLLPKNLTRDTVKLSMVIAMDGPVASGKGTISKLLAKKLNYLCLDTGAIYRAIALCDLRGKDYHQCQIEIKCSPDKRTLVFLDGEDVTKEIRSIEVSNHVAVVAMHTDVQDRVHQIQHQTAGNFDLVVEGRETTSVAFPDAAYKFYVNASLEERAHRRYMDYVRRGEQITLAEVLAATKERDRLDMERKVAPLVKVPDAIEIDTTGRMADEVVDELLAIILK
ncbi:MAG: (d)CMP kinase [Eubacteriales bacterium]|nr:(d)CMP kinase [Eubacteriales bacterium]